MARPPAVAVIGRSDSGKTTLLERLVPELRRRGLAVGVVKHVHHGDVDADVPGKDTWRHQRAGASPVVLYGPTQLVVYRQGSPPPPIEEVIARECDGCDLVLIEGYRTFDGPRVEVVGDKPRLLGPDAPGVVAVMADRPVEARAPTLPRDAVAPLADLILARLGLVAP
jgi:molybdopterin-guanine dinucleotide biosynthesis protein B